MAKDSKNDPSRIKYQKLLVGKLFAYKYDQYVNLPSKFVPRANNSASTRCVGFALVTFDSVQKHRSRYYADARVLVPVKDFNGHETYMYVSHKCHDLQDMYDKGDLQLYDENKHPALGEYTHYLLYNHQTQKDEYHPIDTVAVKAYFKKKKDEEHKIHLNRAASGNVLILGNPLNIQSGTSLILNALQTPKTSV